LNLDEVGLTIVKFDGLNWLADQQDIYKSI